MGKDWATFQRLGRVCLRVWAGFEASVGQDLGKGANRVWVRVGKEFKREFGQD